MRDHHRQTQPGSVIELCGLPGAGKTTLASALVHELAGYDLSVRTGASAVAAEVPGLRRVSVKMALTLAEMLAHPAGTASCTASIARSNPPSVADLGHRAVQWAVTQRLLRAAHRRAGLHVFDEGLIQTLWSVGLRGNVDHTLRALDTLHGWTGPDLLVVVEAPEDVVLERLVSRGSRHARSQALDPARRRIELEHGQRLLDLLVDWWSTANTAASVIRVPHGENGADVATRVAALVSRAGIPLPRGWSG